MCLLLEFVCHKPVGKFRRYLLPWREWLAVSCSSSACAFSSFSRPLSFTLSLTLCSPRCRYVFVDTPGQIEIFTWSASGTIITDSLASQFPTVCLYVVDTPRNATPTTFMSNMLYACRSVPGR